MSGPRDTIAAVATPPGPGGVGILRLSGPDAIAIVAALLGRTPEQLCDRRLVHAVARDGLGGRLDEVLAVAMRGPRSFTGEDVAEVHGHGGTVNLARLLREVLRLGGRAAEPGEFTRRAVEHGRLDLARAEGLLAVIEAGSERAWRIAQDQLGGAVGVAVRRWRTRGIAVLAEVEAALDFPEDGLETPISSRIAGECDEIGAGCRALAETFRLGRAVRDGAVVALAGPVNAGKSSLFNALVGRERSIVSAEPGTTRDYVEARVEWDGVVITLVDTAGMRSGTDDVEQRGIALARARLETADVIAWASDDAATDAGAAEHGARALLVRTKGDLAGGAASASALVTSATTGLGLATLRAAVLARLGVGGAEGTDEVVITSERQRDALGRAADRFAGAAASVRGGIALEMAALDLRDAVRGLGEVVGEETGEAVRDELFARFCIGK